MSGTVPLQTPSNPHRVSLDTVTAGPPIPPIERIKLFSDKQWEEFVLEWADSLRVKYHRVERHGGAGDMGRDIVAFPNVDNDVWDNYQCKHYDHPLRPSNIWTELGKLVYYTHRGDFTYPQQYWFVAPQGAGTTLSNLLKKPAQLRQGLIENWDKYCKTQITSTQEVPLDEDLSEYIASLDFNIFDYVPPLRLIDQHCETPWYVTRFGGGLPPRPEITPPPANPALNELVYLRKLFEAYGDRLKREVNNLLDINSEGELRGHYADSRIEFYSAESLRAFSRDTLPPRSYEQLQDEIHAGIRDEIRGDHDDGYKRVLAVARVARDLQLTSHALVSRLTVRDRGGICHQLANDRDEVRWVKS
jgi:hypothetical protein